VKKVQVTTGDRSFHFELRKADGQVYITSDGTEHPADLARLGNSRYSLIVDGRSHEVGVEFAPEGYTVSAGARTGRFLVEDYEVARMKRVAGIGEAVRLKSVTAPMPGLVVHVHCEPGAEIQKGDPMVVMEAMKMENDIRSPLAGKVKTIRVNTGQSVEKGQVLVEFE
jgi:acetyl/propionyl-CoA carboxylase alpha subunit